MMMLNMPAAAALAKALLGTKLGMTQTWGENGVLRPATVVRVDTSVVIQVRTIKTNGHKTAQLTFDGIDASKVTKPLAGHFARAGVEPCCHVAEIHTSLVSEFTPGRELVADTFEIDQLVDATGTSKGKGFTGVMKRYSFTNMDTSHGTHRNYRKPGFIGVYTTPGHIFKGLRVTDCMGHAYCTVQNLKIHGIDVDRGVLLVNGAVPGPKGSVVAVRTAMKGA